MPFATRKINVSFKLASGSYGSGGNSATISGLRVHAKIVSPGAANSATAEIVIYGLPLSLMNQLTTLGTQINFSNQNTITLEAGDSVNGMFTAFSGTIVTAYADIQAQPNGALVVNAIPGFLNAIKPTKPNSVKGTANVANLMQQIASANGLSFEGNGVSAKVMNPYLHGSPRSQIVQLARMAGLEFDLTENKLAIWETSKGRSGSSTTLSSSTGMVGYPAYNQSGIIVKCEWQPALLRGRSITVQSELTPACGSWNVYSMEVNLESETPNGAWFAVLSCYRLGGTPS